MKVLAIGNSFSGNALRYLPALCRAAGEDLVLGHAMIGGCPLDKHVRLARLREAVPEDPEGAPYWLAGRRAGLVELLRAEAWETVTIQQFSGWSYRIETYRPHAAELCAIVREHAPAARTRFHQTWAYRSDDPLFTDGFTAEAMYEGLSRAYREMTAELGLAPEIPVGEAFRRAGADPAWRFERDPHYDFARPAWPVLPRQRHSLHVGHFWSKTPEHVPVLAYDGHHAGPAGEFLGGCVWFETLFRRDARENPFSPGELPLADAAFLKEAAHAVARGGRHD